MGISVFPIPSAGGGQFSRYQQLTTSGTWTHPDGYAEPRLVKVLMYGGGGGGGGGSASANQGTSSTRTHTSGIGGGSGFVVYQEFLVSANTTYTIGAGGVGSAGSTTSGAVIWTASGGTGGSTTFGPLTATGGSGGRHGGDLNSISSESWHVGAQGGQASPYQNQRTDWARNTWAITGAGYPAGINFQFEKGSSWRNYNGASLNVDIRGNQTGPISTGSSSAGPFASYSGPYEYWALLANAGWNGGQVAENSGAVTGFTATDAELAGTGRFPGGQNGANRAAASGSLTANAGSSPASGFSGGGGGGGSAVVMGAGTATSGAGGNGAPGMIEIWY
jgi:hypothetical protein